MRNIFVVGSLSLTLLFLGTACEQGNGTTANALDVQSADWAMESNFKLDFGEKAGLIQELKGKETELMKHILDAVEAGTLDAYHYETEQKLTEKELKEIFRPVESIITYDDDGYEAGEQMVENLLNRPAVKKFRVKQEWFWDAETNRLESKVKGLAPMETVYNEDGETVRGDLPLFWVFFN